MRICWCGNADLFPFSPEYGECRTCGTLVYLKEMPPEQSLVRDDETDFYGKKYWLDHQQEAFGYDNIYTRARNDLTERNLHWLKALLNYRLPPARVLELGCAHGSFVTLLQQAGFDAFGVEMSPWVVDFGQKTFNVPIFLGPVENLEIPSGSLDVIALMDVLEHLPDPVATMTHCLQLLKLEGLLLLQTPQFIEGMNYNALVESKGAFLEQLKADEHLYLFSERSVNRLFKELGAGYIQFMPAIFGHYDMFFAVSRVPIGVNSNERIEAAMANIPRGRLALALLDIYARESETVAKLLADKSQLTDQLSASEADRAARLEVIESQGKQLGQLSHLKAEREDLKKQLASSEADRSARLEVIESQGQQLGQLIAQLEACEADRAGLYANWLIKIGIKTGLVATKRE